MPVKVFEAPTLFRRRYCECCGYPSLGIFDMEDGSTDWTSTGCACDLCEWESQPLDAQGDPLNSPEEERNDGLTLEQARANLARFESIYDPSDLPEWKLSAPSPEVEDARRTLREAYEALAAAAPGAQWEPWDAVLEAERSLSDALATQQAADEEQVAGEWDDSEEQSI